DLRRLGANDLRSALATVSGVDAPPGGDPGPAGSVPSFWGLHEFDAFLLVVDGVPWGGAFNPAVPSLDLNDVERIEIVKGAAGNVRRHLLRRRDSRNPLSGRSERRAGEHRGGHPLERRRLAVDRTARPGRISPVPAARCRPHPVLRA